MSEGDLRRLHGVEQSEPNMIKTRGGGGRKERKTKGERGEQTEEREKGRDGETEGERRKYREREKRGRIEEKREESERKSRNKK